MVVEVAAAGTADAADTTKTSPFSSFQRRARQVPASAPFLFVLLAACGDGARPVDAGVPLLPATPATFGFVLDAGAFPPASWPSVVVYVPSGWHRETPLHVVVWLHGNGNCAANVIRDSDGECTPGAGLRSAHGLAAQLETSLRNALLIVPEMTYNGEADPGNLTRPGGFRALLAETLADLRPSLGELDIDDVAPLVVAAHSGGYRGMAGVVSASGLPVAEVWQFDSLYGEIPEFVTWIEANLVHFESRPPASRFADVYTHEGGTEANSLNLAETAEVDWLPDAGAVLDDRSLEPLTDAELRQGLVFKRSALSHDDVARVWFQRLLSTSGLPSR
jgi:hypothetical protein